jgi:hypothetical protein
MEAPLSFGCQIELGRLLSRGYFPRLYSLSNHMENMVDHFGVRNGDTCSWSFSCRRELFAWENDLVVQLKDRLALVRLVPEEDVWRWLPDLEGIFSVKSTYLLLENSLRTSEELGEEALVVFYHIWESPAPSKVIAFSWKLLYDRIPTRLNLDYRGIIHWRLLGIVCLVLLCWNPQFISFCIVPLL